MSKKESTTPTYYRWTGDSAFIPGSGRLEPNRIYPAEELPAGTHQHPLFVPATLKQFEAQAKRQGADSKGDES